MDNLLIQPTIEPNFKTDVDFYIGLSLALVSCLFIGTSFVIKKKSLLRLVRRGHLRAGAGGFGYLRDWMWWLGLLFMGGGELANFAAYAFAPASLVTPLGALSVLVSAVLAAKFHNEHLNTIGKCGCLLCLLGSTVVVLHAPKEEEFQNLDDLLAKMQMSALVYYLMVIGAIVFSIILYWGPRYGSRFVVVYVTLCSAIGSVTVMACKVVGLAIKEQIFVVPTTSQSASLAVVSWPGLLVIALGIFVQMNYLNKALDLFNTSVVTPIYYVMFTTLVSLGSAILFKEWAHMTTNDTIGSFCGFLILVVAIFLISSFRDGSDVRFNSSQPLLRPNSREYGSNCYVRSLS